MKLSLLLKRPEFAHLKGSFLWQIVRAGWRMLRPVRVLANVLLHPYIWLNQQRWFWQFQVWLRRNLIRFLPQALKQRLKGAPIFVAPGELDSLLQGFEGEPVHDYQHLTLLPHLTESALANLPKLFVAQTQRRPDVICFSIIDWSFRYQRPQQIMSQYAAHGHRVFYLSTTNCLPADAEPRVAVREIKQNIFEIVLAAQSLPNVYGEVVEGDNGQALLESLAELRQICRIDAAIAYVMHG
jgi:hypothetical protein